MLGFTPFSTIGFGVAAALILVVRGRPVVVSGLLPLIATAAWIGLSMFGLNGMNGLIGWAQRFAEFTAIVSLAVYLRSAGEISARKIVGGFLVIWFSMVLLGVLAVLFPNVQLVTPVGLVMPGSIAGNELVSRLVFPPLAEVQEPWGAAEPFNRPAAPFPYTNSWGMAYVLLLPVAIYCAATARYARMRIVLWASVLVSVWPALETTNRGMYLGLAFTLLAVLVRQFTLARWRGLVITATGALVAVIVALRLGAAEAILGRQEVSNTTEGRGSIYEATVAKVLESPLIGWGNPSIDPSIGIALGTQGYAWTLLYCTGFVGLALFIAFLAGVVLRGWWNPSSLATVLLAQPITVLATMWFYGLGVTQLLIVVLSCTLLLRSRGMGGVP